MKKQIAVLGFALCSMLLAPCSSVDAQQTGKVFRIGFLVASTAASNAGLLETFRQEMGKFGWVEGKNIAFEYRMENKSLSACLNSPRTWLVSRSM